MTWEKGEKIDEGRKVLRTTSRRDEARVSESLSAGLSGEKGDRKQRERGTRKFPRETNIFIKFSMNPKSRFPPAWSHERHKRKRRTLLQEMRVSLTVSD